MARKTSKSQDITFEQSVDELERIVGALETGELGLGEALKAYEEGIKHLKQCHELLEKAERRIELLSGVDADGNPLTEAFEEHLSNDLTEKASARRRKRTAGNPASGDAPASRRANVDDPQSLF